MKKYYKKSIFFRILAIGLLPIFIISSFTVILQMFQIEYRKDGEITSSTKIFESSMNRIEKDLDEVITNIELLYSDDNIKQLMFLDSNSPMSIFQKYEIKKTLTKTKNIYDFIENIAVVNCANSFVIDANRECSLDVYFNTQRQYADYDLEFWKSFQSKKEFYTFLPPVAVFSEGRKEIVSPLVISCMNGMKSKSYIIVDVKCDYIYATVTQNERHENESLLVMIGDTIYNVKTGEKVNKAKLSEQIKDKKVFRYTENSTEFIGFLYTNKLSYLGTCTFIGLIPRNVLLKDIYTNMYLILFFIFLMMIINILLCYFFNKKLYKPIESIKKVLEQSNYKREHFESEFELIEKSFEKMNLENILLRNDAQKMLSVSKEQYLIQNLEFAEADDEQKIKRVFKESNIVFEQEYFLVAHIEVNYSKKFFEEFNSEQYMRICNGISSFFYSEFHDKESVILSKSNEAFIIIFNMEKENDRKVFDRINQLEDVIKFDKELVSILIGLGQMHKGLHGLQMSYAEANRAYLVLQAVPHQTVLQYNPADEKTPSLQYSLEQENKLFNYIIGANRTEAMHFVEGIALQNYNCGGDLLLKKAYNQIMQTILRAASVKGIDCNQFTDGNEINPDQAFDMLRLEEFIHYVNKLLRQVTAFEGNQNKVVDIEEIVAYINAHCAEELYLDNVAERFNISGKYLSKLIKANLGIGFNQYVSMRKIEKAKELLVTTDYHISEIMGVTGFMSKATFLRVFKKFEGVTPSEYRNLFKKYQKKETEE